MGDFDGTHVLIIGFKAPGNYSDQFWSDKILALFCGGPKLPNSMIAGFLSPGEPLFMHLSMPEYFTKYEKHIMDTF